MNCKKPQKKVIILCGPTAVGKTAAATALAKKIPLEIINADSGQIYREMDIGTAKPTKEERGEVPFHLLDILNPDEVFSAADFRKLAREAIGKIISRGRLPLVVGGTGLYIKALAGGLFQGPGRDPKIRRELEERLQAEGNEKLHSELAAVDPTAASSIPKENRHRLIRALEVYKVTGRPISSFWHDHRFQEKEFELLKVGLDLPLEGHRIIIRERIEEMVLKGLFDEVEAVLRKWGGDSPGLKRIGYQEVVSHLEGKKTREEAIELIERHTRQYAKRQRTWFRRDLGISWFSPNSLREIEKTVTTFIQ